jgi:hypothetical protein
VDNLDLIDWRMVGFAGLWILGLAIELSVLGFADYHAKVNKSRFRDELRKPSYQVWINLGLALFSLGVLGSSRSWWETALWALLAAAFIFYAFQALRQARSDGGQRG